MRFSRKFDRVIAQANLLRTEGTDALLAAAREADVSRFLAAQSFASYRYPREGGPVKTEDDPLDRAGIALRYGGFYGAGNDGLIEPVRKRQIAGYPSGYPGG